MYKIWRLKHALRHELDRKTLLTCVSLAQTQPKHVGNDAHTFAITPLTKSARYRNYQLQYL